jgi:hypothetical protein
MMDMLWNELTMSGVALDIESSVWDVVPSSLGLISEHDVGSVVPLQPSHHSLREHPGAHVIWSLVQPMVQWRLETVSPSADVSWELTLESWNDVVELKGIGSEMNPSRVSGEQAQGISWPETVVLMPASNIWLSLLHVFDEIINIEFESSAIIFLQNIL